MALPRFFLLLLAGLASTLHGFAQDGTHEFDWVLDFADGGHHIPNVTPGKVFRVLFYAGNTYVNGFEPVENGTVTYRIPDGTTFLASYPDHSFNSYYADAHGNEIPMPAPNSSGVGSFTFNGSHSGFFAVIVLKVKPANQVKNLQQISFRGGSDITVTTGVPGSLPPGEYRNSGSLDIPLVHPNTLFLSFTTPSPDTAIKAGQQVHYGLKANTDTTTNSISVSVVIPPGTKSPTLITPGNGVFAKGKITWPAVLNADVATYGFTVTVEDAKAIKNLRTTTARAVGMATFPDKKNTGNSTSLTLDIQRPLQITGHIHDVSLDFPQRTEVSIKNPVVGAEVQLIDANNAVVDSVMTTSTGSYRLETPDFGSYTVRVRKLTDEYSGGAYFGTLKPKSRYLTQEQAVTVFSSQTAPLVKDLFLPCAIVDQAAQHLFNLTHLTSEFLGFVPNRVSYDTTAIETAITTLVTSQEQFPGVFTGAGPRDGYNALIRLDAFLSLLEARWKDNAQEADDLAKTVALAIAIDGIKEVYPQGVNKSLVTGNKFARDTVLSKSVEALKITLLTTVIGNYLPKFLNSIDPPLSSETKSAIIEICAKAVRFGLGAFTPGAIERDLVFEAIFQAIRLTIFNFVNEEYTETTQHYLNDAGDHFANRLYSENTNQTLIFLEFYDAEVNLRSDQLHNANIRALTYKSIVRAADGIFFKVQGAIGLTGTEFGKALAFDMRRVSSFFKKPLDAAVLSAFAVAASAPVIHTIAIPVDVELEATAAFSGPVVGAHPFQIPNPLDLLPKRAPAPGAAVLRPQYQRASAAAGASPPASVSAYLAMLDQLQAAAQKNDVAAYALLRDGMIAAHDDLFAFLTPLTDRSIAITQLGAGATATAADDCSAMLNQTYAVGGHISFLYTALEIWAVVGDSVSRSTVLTEIGYVRAALLAAGRASGPATAALAGVTLPGHLTIIDSAPSIVPVMAGARFAATYRLTNAGNVALPAGVAQVFLQPGLVVLSDPIQNLPALAPAESVELSWLLQAGAFTTPAIGSYRINGGLPGVFSSEITSLQLIQPQ